MKILNLYAGIGGNRKFWGNNHEIIAIEHDHIIGKIYKDFFPNDKVIITNAHQYLLEHFKEFDFIWSSPPCPSHSKARFANQIQNKPIYPSMTLYQEIIFLEYYFKGKYCVENVVAFYKPLIKPFEIAKHWFWTNFYLTNFVGEGRGMGIDESIENLQKIKGFDLSPYKGINKNLLLRNCVEPQLGKHIFDLVLNPYEINIKLF